MALLSCWQQGAWLRNLCEEHYVEQCVKILPKENVFRWRQHDGVDQHLPHGKNLNLLKLHIFVSVLMDVSVTKQLS